MLIIYFIKWQKHYENDWTWLVKIAYLLVLLIFVYLFYLLRDLASNRCVLLVILLYKYKLDDRYNIILILLFFQINFIQIIFLILFKQFLKYSSFNKKFKHYKLFLSNKCLYIYIIIHLWKLLLGCISILIIF